MDPQEPEHTGTLDDLLSEVALTYPLTAYTAVPEDDDDQASAFDHQITGHRFRIARRDGQELPLLVLDWSRGQPVVQAKLRLDLSLFRGRARARPPAWASRRRRSSL